MRHWLIRMLYRCLHRFRWLLWWVWSPARSHQRARVPVSYTHLTLPTSDLV